MEKKIIFVLLLSLVSFGQISYAATEVTKLGTLELLMRYTFSGVSLPKFAAQEHIDEGSLRDTLVKYTQGEFKFVIPELNRRIKENFDIESNLLKVINEKITIREYAYKNDVKIQAIYGQFKNYANGYLDFKNPQIDEYIERLNKYLKDSYGLKSAPDLAVKLNLPLNIAEEWKALNKRTERNLRKPYAKYSPYFITSLHKLEIMMDLNQSSLSINQYASQKNLEIKKIVSDYKKGKLLAYIFDLEPKFATELTPYWVARFGVERLSVQEFAKEYKIDPNVMRKVLDKYMISIERLVDSPVNMYLNSLEEASDRLYNATRDLRSQGSKKEIVEKLAKSFNISVDSIVEWTNWKYHTSVQIENSPQKRQNVDTGETSSSNKKMRIENLIHEESGQKRIRHEKMNISHLLNPDFNFKSIR